MTQAGNRGWCYHTTADDCRLVDLWVDAACDCTRDDCRHAVWDRAVTVGEVAYRSPSHRKAFRAGWNAFIAGVAFEAAPGAERGHRRAWTAGWAWANHHRAVDDADTVSVLRALGDRDAPTCLV